MNIVLYDWPYLGASVALVWLIVMFGWPRASSAPSRYRDPSWLAALMLPIYMLHQFEEHAIDLYGRHYWFIHDLCMTLGHPSLDDCPADATFVFCVNVGAVWLAGALATLYRNRNPMIGACAWGIPLVNGVIHVGSALRNQAYNPGVLTSVVLFLPIGIYVVRTLYRSGLIDRPRIVAIFASGGLLHVVLLAALLAYSHGLIPRFVMLVLENANGLIPALIGALVGFRKPLGSIEHKELTSS